ncbi:MAG: hypothetical protein SH856_12720 [Flavobacteriales bacterium]|nr:hypothetical protein [Flavobacteriales bacterium]
MPSINLSIEEVAYMAEYYRKEYVAAIEKLNHFENILRQLGGTPATPGRSKPDPRVALGQTQSVSADSTVPAKRKRGRQPGWNKIEGAAPAAKATKRRRRRGRPAGSATKAAAVVTATSTGKRKPGRPAGWRKNAVAGSPAPAVASDAPKRKGGRPLGWRKNPTAASSASATGSPKRKGGRPLGWRKNPDAKAAATALVQVGNKKKPGRPVGWRKNPETAANTSMPENKPGRPARAKKAARKKGRGKKGPSSIWPEWILNKLNTGKVPLTYLDFASDAMKEFKIPLEKEKKTTQNINAHIFRMRKDTNQVTSVAVPNQSSKFIVLNDWLDDGGKLKDEFVAKLSPSIGG